MLAYNKTLAQFFDDINRNLIVDEILSSFHNVGDSEKRSWRNSLPQMASILRLAQLPEDIRVGIEYQIRLANKRVDFIISGCDEYDNENAVIIELKQWDGKNINHTDMPDIIDVRNQDFVHPSWQAVSYSTVMQSFNECFETDNIKLIPCTFLHNYEERYVGELKHEVYNEGLNLAPAFIGNQYEELSRFIKKYIKKAAKRDLLFTIDQGRIKPTKMLIDSLTSALKGNNEFTLIDQQRVAFSNIIDGIKKNEKNMFKHVYIIRGGAGTGKSVIAINLISHFINSTNPKTAFYVSKSGYVRENYSYKLAKSKFRDKRLNTLFLPSSSFIDSIRNQFDILVIDEAHRLTKRSKFGHLYKGDNQIKEIIHAAKNTIFFIDETQTIDIKDFGTIENIVKYAEEEHAVIHMENKYILESQFRCNGSDEYISWLESILYNKEYNKGLTKVDYEIKVIDDISDLKKLIVEKNKLSSHPSRILSGDVFPWLSRENKNAIDININDFHAQWNKTKSFASNENSIDEVGCIHTSQGMEFEYTGLIVGNDLLYRNNKIITDYTKHPKGAGEFRRENRRVVLEEDAEIIDKIIRNTYKVLFTRGQKGTYLYIMDPELREYFKKQIDILLK